MKTNVWHLVGLDEPAKMADLLEPDFWAKFRLWVFPPRTDPRDLSIRAYGML